MNIIESFLIGYIFGFFCPIIIYYSILPIIYKKLKKKYEGKTE